MFGLARMRALLLVAMMTMPALAMAEVRVVDLVTDAMAEPLGIESTQPRLSWRLEAARRGVLQAGYELQVATSVAALEAGQPDLWSTGRVNQRASAVVYAGQPLLAHQSVVWRVRIWDDRGALSAWSQPARFELAFTQPDQWQADWIAGPPRRNPGPVDDPLAGVVDVLTGEFCRPVGVPGALGVAGFDRLVDYVLGTGGACREPRPAPLLRRAFELSEAPARARLHISGLAYARVQINGAVLAPHQVLDPGYTHYDRTVLYRSYDVTDRLQAGVNAIGVELGSGFYDYDIVTEWAWNHASWRGEPRMIAELHLEYADGRREVVVSDQQWRVHEGPTRYDNINVGETYDARRRLPGWAAPDYEAQDWLPARQVEPPGGRLTAQTHPSIERLGVVEPVAVTQPLPGVWVYDLGEQITGWAEVAIEAPPGVAVAMTYGEALSRTGLVGTTSNLHIGDQIQTDYFVASGDGIERWTPRFSYKGFRYLQISGPLNAPFAGELAEVTFERVRSAVPSIGGFTSSDDLLNTIYERVERAIANNLHGIVTDTPTFEKNGWTGDAQLTAPTASLLFDLDRLYAKWLGDLRDAQRPSGEIPVIVPSGGGYGYTGVGWEPAWGATPAWDAALFEIPWTMYLRRGDLRVLEDNFPAMRRYLDDWIGQWASLDDPHVIEAGLGDHVTSATTLPSPLDLVLTDAATLTTLVSTAYYALFAKRAADIAELLGESATAAHYRGLWAAIRAAFHARWFDAESGTYRVPDEERYFQTANVLPLAFGLVPEAERTRVLDGLLADIEAQGGNLNAGIVGTRYLLPVLEAMGAADTAHQVATQTDYPSWGEWVALGYTALSESWGETIRSRNHHMFGSIGQWMIEQLAGLQLTEPGYRSVRLAPSLPADGPEVVEAWHDTPHGRLSSRWQRLAPGRWQADITVPPNVVATLHFPADASTSVTESAGGAPTPASLAPGVRRLRQDATRRIFELGSGRYRFESSAAAPAEGAESSAQRSHGGVLSPWSLLILLLLRRRR